MAHHSHAIAHVKSALRHCLPAKLVDQAVEQSGYRFRPRTLGPLQTVLLCVGMILGANASLATIRIDAGGAFTAAALCKARARLSLLLLEVLNALIIRRSLKSDGPPRILLVDATNYYLPDSKQLRRHYGHPRQKGRRGRRVDYPQMRVLCVVELYSGMILEQVDFPSRKQESPMLRHILEVCRPGDTLVLDRGFVSFANFCLLKSRGVHFVARVPSNLHARERGRRRFIHRGRRGSGKVQWDKPVRRTRRLTRRQWRGLPPQLELRQLTVKVSEGRCRGKLVLITDLSETAAKTIRNWYRRRWEIETDFRHLKQTLNLEFFTTRSRAGVKRELLLRQVAYNLIRQTMLHASRKRGVPCGRLSFAQAARLLLHGQWGMLLCLSLLPQRRRSTRPRRLKYRGKNYPLLQTRPRPQRQLA